MERPGLAEAGRGRRRASWSSRRRAAAATKTTPRPNRRPHGAASSPRRSGSACSCPAEAQDLARHRALGRLHAVEKDGKPTGEWQRHEREETVPVRLSWRQGRIRRRRAVPNSDGLEIVTSVRRVRRLEDLRGLPKGTRAVSVFLVNRRSGRRKTGTEGHAVRVSGEPDARADRPFVPRPNPRGQDAGDDTGRAHRGPAVSAT